MRAKDGLGLVILSWLCCSLCGSGLMAQQEAGQSLPAKVLPLEGEVFAAGDRPAFLIPGRSGLPRSGKAWVWYAPTLPNLPGPEERWMFERFTAAGIAVAGIDAGESYGSPRGNAVYSALYESMQARGFSARPLLLGRSRGGLMTLSWAVEHPQCVSGFAGIYPVCNLSSYPGIERAAGAFELTPERLRERLGEFNPVDRFERLVKAKVPLFAIHGDVDQVVPLEANSGLLKKRCEELGGKMELVIPPGQGHSMWPGFFQSEELVAFVLRHADPAP